MLGWCIVTLASARLKASVRFPLLRGMYQRGGTCKGCDKHRRYGFYRHLGVGELPLLSRLVEKVHCKPLQVLQAEVAEPLQLLAAQQAALLLPVLLLVELGAGVGVVQLTMRCSGDNLTLEVVDFFGGGDDLQLLLRPLCP